MAEQIPNPDKIKEEKEKIEKEVKKFKERAQGLNPDMFAVPGEEDLEEENIPEEMILAYELEEKIAEYTEKAQLVKEGALREIELDFNGNQTSQGKTRNAIIGLSSLINSSLWPEMDKENQEKLIKKAKLVKDKVLNYIESELNRGQTDKESAWNAILTLSFLIHSPLWPEIIEEKQKELIRKTKLVKDRILDKIESYIDSGQTNKIDAWLAIYTLSALINSPLWPEIGKKKQKELIKKVWLVKSNVLKKIEFDFDKGQLDQWHAWHAIRGLSFLTTLKNYLLKVANQKLKEQEHQKALHPEKEIPPRPEFPTF